MELECIMLSEISKIQMIIMFLLYAKYGHEYMCLCMCVCMRGEGRGREGERDREKEGGERTRRD